MAIRRSAKEKLPQGTRMTVGMQAGNDPLGFHAAVSVDPVHPAPRPFLYPAMISSVPIPLER